MPVLDVYPDANTGSTTVDGYLQETGGNWSTVRNSTSAGLVNTSGTVVAAQNQHEGSTYYMARMFFHFNTAALTSSATISAASISAAWFNWGGSPYDGETLKIVASTAANNNDLTGGDWDQIGSTEFGSFSYVSPSQRVAIALNASGLAAINKTGVTKLGARTSGDINNTPCTLNKANTFYFGSAEHPTDKTYLSITYTLPGPSGIAKFDDVAGASVSKLNDVSWSSIAAIN